MEKVELKDFINATKGKFIFGNPRQKITNISTDTRKLNPGDVFIALKGKNFDGHQFIYKAIEKGATGIVCERIPQELDNFFPNLPAVILVEDTLKALGDFAKYYRKQFSPTVIAVGGSNGKTTTKEMIYSILNLKRKTLANFGSFNNLIGVPLTIFRLNSEFIYCVLELGISVKNEIDRLLEISNPQICILTDIGKEHLEFLGSIEEVVTEETKLVSSLNETQTAILNIDNPYIARLRPNLKCKVITYGFTNTADVYLRNIKLSPEETKFELCIFKNSVRVVLPVIGKFNVLNAAGASAIAFSLGIDLNTIKTGLERFAAPQMRSEKIQFPSGAVIINDAYNANPDSMRAAISSFVETYPQKKKIVVLGDMLELGRYTEEEHKLLGKFLTELPIQEIYFYGDRMKFAFSSMQSNQSKAVHYTNNSAEIIAKLKAKLNDPQVVMLFKASRAIMLERIIDGLIEY